jgi:large subunit ribosomal protein L37
MEAKSLPEPVCTQCVATDGETFDFVYFQLNTLDFTSAQGVKNLVWFDNDNLMYNKIIPRRSMLRNTRYEDYNPEVMKKLVATYMFSGKPASVAHHAEPSVAARASSKA